MQGIGIFCYWENTKKGGAENILTEGSLSTAVDLLPVSGEGLRFIRGSES